MNIAGLWPQSLKQGEKKTRPTGSGGRVIRVGGRASMLFVARGALFRVSPRLQEFVGPGVGAEGAFAQGFCPAVGREDWGQQE